MMHAQKQTEWTYIVRYTHLEQVTYGNISRDDCTVSPDEFLSTTSRRVPLTRQKIALPLPFFMEANDEELGQLG